jgi:hypothetical protein
LESELDHTLLQRRARQGCFPDDSNKKEAAPLSTVTN